jgi:hypothetical protein
MRLIHLSLLLFMSLSLYAVDNVIVRQNTGDKSISISKISHISFPSDGSGVVMNFTDGTSEKYARGSFISLRFNGNVSGIEEIGVAEQTGLSFSPDYTTISCADENAMIEVYSSTGALIVEGKSTLNISNLVSGTYIVKAGNEIIKIVKR